MEQGQRQGARKKIDRSSRHLVSRIYKLRYFCFSFLRRPTCRGEIDTANTGSSRSHTLSNPRAHGCDSLASSFPPFKSGFFRKRVLAVREDAKP